MIGRSLVFGAARWQLVFPFFWVCFLFWSCQLFFLCMLRALNVLSVSLAAVVLPGLQL